MRIAEERCGGNAREPGPNGFEPTLNPVPFSPVLRFRQPARPTKRPELDQRSGLLKSEVDAQMDGPASHGQGYGLFGRACGKGESNEVGGVEVGLPGGPPAERALHRRFGFRLKGGDDGTGKLKSGPD